MELILGLIILTVVIIVAILIWHLKKSMDEDYSNIGDGGD